MSPLWVVCDSPPQKWKDLLELTKYFSDIVSFKDNAIQTTRVNQTDPCATETAPLPMDPPGMSTIADNTTQIMPTHQTDSTTTVDTSCTVLTRTTPSSNVSNYHSTSASWVKSTQKSFMFRYTIEFSLWFIQWYYVQSNYDFELYLQYCY